MAIARFSHVGLCVSDLERSLRFYRDGLGFAEEGRLRLKGPTVEQLLGLPDTDLEAVFLERDGTRLELLHYPARRLARADAPGPMDRPGLTHLSLRVTDLDATLDELAQLGGRALAETRIARPELGAAAVFVTDPDGARVELVEAPGDPARAPAA